MSEVARVGLDLVGSSGLIQTKGNTVKIAGIEIAVKTATISTHDGHVGATVTSGSDRVKIAGDEIARKDDTASCGHTIVSGSSRVKIS